MANGIEPYTVSKVLPPEKSKKSKLKVVANDDTPKQEVLVPIAEGMPEVPPMYTLSWVVQLNYKDKMGEHTLGTYSNSVQYDTQKLLERAATMVGQQVFQKIVEDQNV